MLALLLTTGLVVGCSEARPDGGRKERSSTTSPVSETVFPNGGNTGVPEGVRLTDYKGPTTITRDNTVIDAKRIRGALLIAADNVTIKRSLVIGHIDLDQPDARVTIVDSEVDGGRSTAPAIGYSNITMSRVNVHGARVSVLCSDNCLIEDSWLHGQYMPPDEAWHVNGYLSNGGSNVVLRHNTIACDVEDNPRGGGCTGPGAIFGDFAPLRDVTVDNNLFVAGPGGWCLRLGHDPGKRYGANPTGIVVTDNVFQRGDSGKCGVWGPVTSFDGAGSGNVWSGNIWTDGTPVGSGS